MYSKTYEKLENLSDETSEVGIVANHRSPSVSRTPRWR